MVFESATSLFTGQALHISQLSLAPIKFMDETMTDISHHIGFISTRFAGTDGVSLETEKWATVLKRLGHKCFYFAGKCDRPAEQSQIVPEAFYRHPVIDMINQQAYSGSWTVTKKARSATLKLPRYTRIFLHLCASARDDAPCE